MYHIHVRTTGPVSPLLATMATMRLALTEEVRAEEAGQGAREPSGWKAWVWGRFREPGT